MLFIFQVLTLELHYLLLKYQKCNKLVNSVIQVVLSKSESVKFSLIESVICLFTDSSVKKYFSLLNQSIFTEIISEI